MTPDRLFHGEGVMGHLLRDLARADPPRWGDLPREKSRVPMTFVLYLVAELSQF